MGRKDSRILLGPSGQLRGHRRRRQDLADAHLGGGLARTGSVENKSKMDRVEEFNEPGLRHHHPLESSELLSTKRPKLRRGRGMSYFCCVCGDRYNFFTHCWCGDWCANCDWYHPPDAHTAKMHKTILITLEECERLINGDRAKGVAQRGRRPQSTSRSAGKAGRSVAVDPVLEAEARSRRAATESRLAARRALKNLAKDRRKKASRRGVVSETQKRNNRDE